MKAFLKRNLWTIVSIIVIVAFFIINANVCWFVKVSGSSMYPTLKPEDFLICVPIHDPSQLQEKSIIVFEHDNKKLVKRIVSTPMTDIPEALGGGQCGENQFFVLGDNMDHSTDSRSFGTISGDSIKSIVLFHIPSFWIVFGIGVIVFIAIVVTGSKRLKADGKI